MLKRPMSQTTQPHLSHPLILGIDLEGIHQDLIHSGINFKVDRTIEIGAVLWDWHHGQPVKIFSELMDENDRLPISSDIEELTGISDSLLALYGNKGEAITQKLHQLGEMMEQAHYLMAHNAKGYDSPMLKSLFRRYSLSMPSKTWIDTQTDIEYPKKIRTHSLAMLEHAHGFINPFPHRAVTDTLSMLKVAYSYDLDRMVQLAQSPMVTVIAQLKAPNWQDPHEVATFNKIKKQSGQKPL